VLAYSDASVITTDDGTAILTAQGGPLPVTLKFFTANMINNNSIQLNWGTSMEINCASYNVERSFDGKSFVSAGSILGAGNTTLSKNYSLIDLLGNNSNNFVYYRLVQVDIDGKKSYSKTVSVRLNKNNNDLIVSPNPFNSFVNVNFESNHSELSTLKVIDARGKELVSKKIKLIKGSNYIQLNELQQK
jgi:hypothetical protein